MAKYRVGLIGAGRKGTQHARAYMLDERTELVAVADGDPENLALFQKRTGVPGYADYRQMLEKEALDIAAPILPVGVNPEGRHCLRASRGQGHSLRKADCGLIGRSRPHGRRVQEPTHSPLARATWTSICQPIKRPSRSLVRGELGAVKRITLLGGSGYGDVGVAAVSALR